MKTYTIFCHVCRKLVDIQAEFISCRDYTATNEQGMSYPIGTCNADQSRPQTHPSPIVRESYKVLQEVK